MKGLLFEPHKSTKGEEGVTLTELLIVLCIIQVVLALAYSIYLFGIQGYVNNTMSIENQSNVRIAMEHISYHIRRTAKVTITKDSLIIGNESYRLSNNTLLNKHNQLATGISEFVFSKPNPSLAYVKITSIPDRKGKDFSLEAYFYLLD